MHSTAASTSKPAMGAPASGGGEDPWPLSFSYGRAMQQAALKLWAADMTGNYAKAQQTVFERAKANGLAALGQWEG